MFAACSSGPPDDKTNEQDTAAKSDAEPVQKEETAKDIEISSIEWKFNINQDEDMNPVSDIYLVINGKEVLVGEGFYGGYEPMNENNPYIGEVPEDAITSAGSFWAGLLSVIYVEREDNKLHVKLGEIDEQSNEPMKWETVKTIDLTNLDE